MHTNWTAGESCLRLTCTGTDAPGAGPNVAIRGPQGERGLTKMKSDMYEDWYRMDIPAAAKGAESSCTLAPELSTAHQRCGGGVK